MPAPKVKKPKPKSKKELQAEMEAHYAKLKVDVEVLTKTLTEVQGKCSALSKNIFNSIPVDLVSMNFGLHKAYDHNQINTDTLVDMIGYLSERRKQEDASVGDRLSFLEERVTTMTHDLNRSHMKTMTYENCFENIHSIENIEQVRDHIYQIQFLANCNEKNIDVYDESNDTEYDGDMNAQLLNLFQLEQRLPGETLLSYILPHLKSYIISELSPNLVSRSDWRTLAERVGVDECLVEEWLKMYLPMGNVLEEWLRISDDSPPTIRQLHRHLMSPSMRRTIVAKRLSDIYDVE